MQKHPMRQKIIALILALALIGALVYALSNRAAQTADNPFAERDTESAHMLQTEALQISIDDPDIAPQDAPTEAPTQQPSQEPAATDAPTQSPAPTELPDLITPDPNKTPAPSASAPAQEQTPRPAPNAPSLITPRPDAAATAGTGDNSQDTQLIYFTTNLINGSTVSTPDLDLIISHKQPALAVKRQTVTLNGVPSNFTGALSLIDGKNIIEITVLYEGAEGRQIQVSKTYTIYLEKEQLIITTDLTDRTVNQLSFGFTAYASIGASRASLIACVNGEKIEGSGNRFSARLIEGVNEILLTATGGGQQLTQRFEIQAELPDGIEINTDLYNHEVDDENFTFYASISGGTDRAALTVVANGETLTGTNGTYACVLSRGNNLIRLKATDVDGVEYTQSYTISFHRYIVVRADEADETMPRFATNIANGMSITGSQYTLQVRGEDGAKKRLYGDHITVELNGATLEDSGEDEGVTYYRLKLMGGENRVKITVWDYEDRYVWNEYILNCETVADGEKIGSITLSVEASTIGLGDLISPRSVDIYQGLNLAGTVAQFLQDNGYEFSNAGTLWDGFYLQYIIRSGITNGWLIPSDLEDAINEDGVMWTNEVSADSLGEFDFTAQSGWMYSVNGQYPNFGMSECYPKDGDVVRIRFTLATGKDIGGGYVNGGGNYGREW